MPSYNRHNSIDYLGTSAVASYAWVEEHSNSGPSRFRRMMFSKSYNVARFTFTLLLCICLSTEIALGQVKITFNISYYFNYILQI